MTAIFMNLFASAGQAILTVTRATKDSQSIETQGFARYGQVQACRVLASRDPAVRILLDYRPALRQRTGVGEYVHEAGRRPDGVGRPRR